MALSPHVHHGGALVGGTQLASAHRTGDHDMRNPGPRDVFGVARVDGPILPGLGGGGSAQTVLSAAPQAVTILKPLVLSEARKVLHVQRGTP
jgi:hypothetical protein